MVKEIEGLLDLGGTQGGVVDALSVVRDGSG